MVGKTVTRADLTETVYQLDLVTKEHAADLVDEVLEAICTALESGENVKLSSFGLFTIRTKSKRTGRNPKTGVGVPIAPRQVIRFSASPVLKAHLNRASSRPSGFDAQDAPGPEEASHATTS